jgi:hypothetical protein
VFALILKTIESMEHYVNNLKRILIGRLPGIKPKMLIEIDEQLLTYNNPALG